jgi:lipocalin
MNCLPILNKMMFVSLLLSMFTMFAKSQTLATVSNVDLKKYLGRWYEVASFPQLFQKGCECTTAEYTSTDKEYMAIRLSHIDLINKNSIIQFHFLS